MDLHTVETYLRPQSLQELSHWQKGWAWLAGGTWMFTEPQPHLTTLVDMEGLGWSELEISPRGLSIGATCVMSQLLHQDFPPEWTGVKALQSAVHELASFKVQNMATIAGNLCLALPASTFAPVMVLLEATYEIWSLDGTHRQVPAQDFQTGAKQTILKPGDVLRQIHIPVTSLMWQVRYKRICVAMAGIAVAIVVAAYDANTGRVRFGLGASVPAPQLIEFSSVPDESEVVAQLNQQLPLSAFLADETASAAYRHQVTQVLMRRSLREMGLISS